MRCLNCRRDGIPIDTQKCPHCMVVFSTLYRDFLRPGTDLRGGQYRIEYPLGKGGFGITYRAVRRVGWPEQVHWEQSVAIKEFFPHGQVVRDARNTTVHVTFDKRDSFQVNLNRFLKEAQLLARLQMLRCPNVVKVEDYFEENGTAYMVMEYLEGVSLRAEIDALTALKESLPENRIRSIGATLVEALATVHSEGFYHLDISPENVMMLGERAILVDFGAARQSAVSTTVEFKWDYAPIELVAMSGRRREFAQTNLLPEDVSVGPESDIFELGMMLHELLTGALPPNSLQRVGGKQWNMAALSEPWRSAIDAAIQIQQEDRPQDIRAWWKTIGEAPPLPILPPEPATADIPVRGQDITAELILTPAEAQGGGMFKGSTPETRHLIQVPPGTPDGAKRTLAGRGKPGLYGGPPGDLIFVIRVRD